MCRVFLLVAAVVLVDTAFYAAISPLLPHYAHELDLSKAGAGVLTASYAAGTLAGSLPSGWLAVRAGSKPTLLIGLGLLAITSVVFGLAHNVVVLDAARFVQGVGGACSWAAGMAWLVGAAPRERRGELIGAAIGAAIVGVLIGPVLGGAATVAGPEAVFSGVAAVAVALGLFALTTPAAPAGEPTRLGDMARGLRRGEVLQAFWLFSLPALFAGAIEVLVPLRFADLGAGGVAIGIAFFAAGGVEGAVSPVVGRISDRRGRMVPIRAGLAGATALGLLLPLPQSALALAALLAVGVAAIGAFWAPAMALLSDAAERTGLGQGLAFATSNLAWAAGHVAGGAGGSGLADLTSDAVPYSLLAAMCALTLVAVSPRARAGGPVRQAPR